MNSSSEVGVIAQNHIKSTPVIDRSIYQGEVSLQEHVIKLCDPDYEIEYNDLINLCIKYLFCHRHSSLVNSAIEIQDIEKFFSVGARYHKLGSQGYKIIDNRVPEVHEDINYFNQNTYGVAMLGDISSSVEIFKSIIEQVIDPEKFDGKYFGLDMGSGTGWLALAQHIQAYRNAFSDIRNIGLEKQESIVATTMELMIALIPIKIEVPKILSGDTTKDQSLYDTISMFVDDRKLTYISNENIPTNSICMDGKNDPFFQNIMALDAFFGDKISQFTQMFPASMSFVSSISQGKHISDFQSRFGLSDLWELNKEMFPDDDFETLGGLMDMSIFQYIYPDAIDVGGENIIKLTKVGKHLEYDKKVIFRRGLRRRWSG